MMYKANCMQDSLYGEDSAETSLQPSSIQRGLLGQTKRPNANCSVMLSL